MAGQFAPHGFKSPVVLAVGALLAIIFLWVVWVNLHRGGGDHQVVHVPAAISEDLHAMPARQLARI